jgi:hypothetical protein
MIMDEKSTSIPTWQTMDYVSWYAGWNLRQAHLKEVVFPANFLQTMSVRKLVQSLGRKSRALIIYMVTILGLCLK